MNVSSANINLANVIRDLVQKNTETVSDGEGVAMVLLWSFLQDHAECHNMDVKQLAREQLEAFIKYADEHLAMARPSKFN